MTLKASQFERVKARRNILEEGMPISARNLKFGAAVVFSLAIFCGAAFAQAQDSLGDQARQARKNKPTTQARTFDNDNLPREDKLSIVGNAQPTPDPNAPASNPAGSNESGKTPPPANGAPADSNNVNDKDAAAKKQAEWNQWKDKIAAQKEAIDLDQRELDVTEGEYKLRAAAMYADVGNRLRNSAQWDKEDAEFKTKIETQKKALADAKDKLESMQEEARKAGVPNSMRE